MQHWNMATANEIKSQHGVLHCSNTCGAHVGKGGCRGFLHGLPLFNKVRTLIYCQHHPYLLQKCRCSPTCDVKFLLAWSCKKTEKTICYKGHAQFILDSYAVSLDDKHGRQGGCEWKSIRQGERNTSRSKFVSGGQLQLVRKVSGMFKIAVLVSFETTWHSTALLR